VPSWGLCDPFNSDTPAALHLSGGSAGLGCVPATRSIFSLTVVTERAALGVAPGLVPSRAVRMVRAHSWGRITTKWSRRARGSVRS
jgi:hypothetical protein